MDGTLARAFAIVTRPSRTWDRVVGMPADTGDLFFRYAAPLALIPAVCGFIGPMFLSFDVASVHLRPEPLSLVLEIVAGYVLSLAAVGLLALWIDLLAPAFGAVRDRRQALKLAVHAPTAFWLAGAFGLWPSLSIPAVVLAGLYSLYTLNLGLPKLMRVPEDRELTYFAAVLVGLIALAVGVGLLSGKAASLGGPLSLV